jgi:nucleoside-diphosphate-sugar epimerase
MQGLDKTILLTGASGVVGSALLEEMRGVPVTCLVHRRRSWSPNVIEVHGDLRHPRLGLGERGFKNLAARVGAVVHCAAVTGFSADAAATTAMNVRGTQHVLELAAAAGAPLYHVSTAFVARSVPQPETGAGSRSDASGPEIYLASKRAAEDLVRRSGIDAVIVRPSIVTGHSETGWTRSFQGFNLITGAVMTGGLPLAPVDPAARIDCVPQDLLARSILSLLRGGVVRGEYWITGGEQAVTASEAMDLCLEVARERGREVPAPRLVPPDMVDRLLRPVFLEQLPASMRWRFEAMLDMVDLIATDEPFPSSLRESGRLLDIGDTPRWHDTVRRSLEYWADRKGLLATTPRLLAA